ncbi:hypothetical protein FB451DRAFT_1110828 [Mycena latifolia]|nr:hypothetical protein FB451DRAFT_1110828 [Mycena latifolia]
MPEAPSRPAITSMRGRRRGCHSGRLTTRSSRRRATSAAALLTSSSVRGRAPPRFPRRFYHYHLDSPHEHRRCLHGSLGPVRWDRLGWSEVLRVRDHLPGR